MRRDLTYSEVLEIGLKARHDDPSAPVGGEQDVHFEAVFEYGHAWLRCLDKRGLVKWTYRLGAREIPQEGWRHEAHCPCRYCMPD